MMIVPEKLADAVVEYIDQNIITLFPNWSMQKVQAVAGGLVVAKAARTFLSSPEKVKSLALASITNEDGTMIDLELAKAFALEVMEKSGGKVQLPLGIDLDSSDIEKLYVVAQHHAG